jgi:hypothetical protein
VKTVEIFSQIGEKLTFIPGIEPVTGFTLAGIAASFTVGSVISQVRENEVTLRGGVTPAGLTLISTLIAVDYWEFTGYEASTYLGTLLLSNADLMAFFASLAVLLKFVKADLPDKYGSFKEILGI